MVLFSIIIPVYNGLEHNLKECLNSIFEQSLNPSQYEVICVDDCSSDKRTIQYLEELLSIGKIRLIKNLKNVRQGGARNRGVENALGEWILFIDQDDYFQKDCLRHLYDKIVSMKENVDVIQVDSTCHPRNSYTEKPQLSFHYQLVTTPSEYWKNNGMLVVSPWRYIINKNFYKNSGLSFEENCRIEDVDWACKLMVQARTIVFFPIVMVHYIIQDNNTTSALYTDRKVVMDNIKAALRTDMIYVDNTDLNRVIKFTVNRYLLNSIIAIMANNWSWKDKYEMLCLMNTVHNSDTLIVRFSIAHPRIMSLFLTILHYPFMILRKIKKSL